MPCIFWKIFLVKCSERFNMQKKTTIVETCSYMYFFFGGWKCHVFGIAGSSNNSICCNTSWVEGRDRQIFCRLCWKATKQSWLQQGTPEEAMEVVWRFCGCTIGYLLRTEVRRNYQLLLKDASSSIYKFAEVMEALGQGLDTGGAHCT